MKCQKNSAKNAFTLCLHTLIYVRGTLGICHVHSKYADIMVGVRCVIHRGQINFFDNCFK